MRERPWRAPRELRRLYGKADPGLRRWLPDLHYTLLDVRRLKLESPELAGNWLAMLLRLEACKDPEKLPCLADKLASTLPQGQPELRRTITIWIDSVFRRAFPRAIIPLVADLAEEDMLEQALIRWAKHVERKGELLGMRKLLLQTLTQRFGRLPLQVRRQIEEISTPRELSDLNRRILIAETLHDTGLV